MGEDTNMTNEQINLLESTFDSILQYVDMEVFNTFDPNGDNGSLHREEYQKYYQLWNIRKVIEISGV
jgi:hypothetical protein